MNEEQKPGISLVKKAEYVALVACFVLTGILYVGNVPAFAQVNNFQSSTTQEQQNTASAGAPTFYGVPQECGTGKINLTWSGVSGATAYQLYRDVTSVKIYENSNASYMDSGLQNGSQHTYYLVTLGGEDTTPRSLTISAPPACATGILNTTTTAGTVPPPVPSNLTATLNTSQGGIVLTWGVSSSGDYNITILRRVGSGSFVTLQTVPSSVHSFADSNITFGTTYEYALRACNVAGCSPHSNSATVQTPANTSTTVANTTSTGVLTPTGTSTPTDTATTTQPPAVQTGTFGILAKSATECNANYIVLTWSRPSDANTYEVYRNDTFVFTTANLYFNDPTLNPDTTYTYKVIALRAGVRFAYGITSAHTLKKCTDGFAVPTEPIGVPAPTSTIVQPTEPIPPNTIEPKSAPKPPATNTVTTQPVPPKPSTTSYVPQSYQPPVNTTEETGARPVVAAPPSALVLSMQDVAETVSVAQSSIVETRDRLIANIDSHARAALEGTVSEHRAQIEVAVNAVRERLIGYVRDALDDIAGATPEALSRLKDRLDAGYQEMDSLAQRSAQVQTGERQSIVTTLDTLSQTIVGASAALQSSGGDQLYKDTNKDGISDYDSVRIYRIDPVAPSPVTVVGTTTLTAGQKVLLGYDPREKELVKVTPEEPRVSLAPETPIYAVKEVRLTPEKKVTIRGTALPNSYVTVYVYSTPIIVTVKTDGAGQWEYTVDKELETGAHTIYAATVDNTGMIVARSVAIPFTQTAEAATLDTAPLGFTASEKPSLFNNPAVIPLLLLSLLFIIGVLYTMGRSQIEKNTQTPLT